MNRFPVENIDKVNSAKTADKSIILSTARTISLTGDVTGSTSFDGSTNKSITATVADDSHNHVIENIDNLQDILDDINNNLIKTKSINPTTEDTDTTTVWNDLEAGVFYFSESGGVIDQPSIYGFLINFVYNKNVFQLWKHVPSGALYSRSGNYGGWGTSWIKYANTTVTDLSIDGKTIAITKSDGTTSTLVTQDTTYSLPTGTSTIIGGVKLSDSTSSTSSTTGGIAATPKAVKTAYDRASTAITNANTANTAATNAANNSIVELSVDGKVITYTKGDGSTGNITTQDTNTNNAVTQTVTTTNAEYPILTKANATATTETKGARFASAITLNPSTGTITATKFKGTPLSAITGLSVSGKTITYTKGDGTTGTITTQDTNTTYSAATTSALGLVKIGSNITVSSGTISLTKSNVTTALGYTPPTTNTTYSTGTTSVAGLTKLYTSTGSSTDGTMTRAAITSALSSISATTVPNVFMTDGRNTYNCTLCNSEGTTNSNGQYIKIPSGGTWGVLLIAAANVYHSIGYNIYDGGSIIPLVVEVEDSGLYRTCFGIRIA